MTGSEVAALVVAVACTFALCLLVATLVWLVRTIRRLTTVVERLDAELSATVAEMQIVVHGAAKDLERTEGLIDAAESTSRLTNEALVTPVIKTMAFAAGASRAASRLRRGS